MVLKFVGWGVGANQANWTSKTLHQCSGHGRQTTEPQPEERRTQQLSMSSSHIGSASCFSQFGSQKRPLGLKPLGQHVARLVEGRLGVDS